MDDLYRDWKPINGDHTNRRCHQIAGPVIFKTPQEPDVFDCVADAPAMRACLALITAGKARVEVSPTGFAEFCFNGIRASVGVERRPWTAIVNVYGWDVVRAAIEGGR